MSALGRIAALGGSELVDGAVTSKNFVMFVPQEDTTITVMSGTSDSNVTPTPNFLTIQNLSGKTLKQGSVISVPDGSVITSLTVSSGSVIAYKKSEQ